AVGACVAVGSLVAIGGTVGVIDSPAADVSPAAPPPQAARLTLIGTSSRPNTPRRVRRRFSNPLDIGSFLFGRAHRSVRPPRAHLPHYRVAWRRSRTPPPMAITPRSAAPAASELIMFVCGLPFASATWAAAGRSPHET